MILRDCRQTFLFYGYSSFEYAQTLVMYGERAEVAAYAEYLIVQEPGCARFVRYPLMKPSPEGSRRRTRAPISAEFLFYLFLEGQKCDALVGDLEERYRLISRRFGQRRAGLWYWTQALRSIVPVVLALAGRTLRRLFGLAALVEMYRRLRS